MTLVEERSPAKERPKQRRHDVDWLRFLLFALLIPYHVLIGYMPWGVYAGGAIQSDVTLGPAAQSAMHWLHQWRLPALFLISGMGTAYAFRRRSVGTFVGERTMRLVVPALFAAHFVVVFQGWVGSLVVGGQRNLWEFGVEWVRGFGDGPVGWFVLACALTLVVGVPAWAIARARPESSVGKAVEWLRRNPAPLALFLLWPFVGIWLFSFPSIETLWFQGRLEMLQHLWFLGNLFVYSLVAIPLFLWARSSDDAVPVRAMRWLVGHPVRLLTLAPIGLVLVELAFKPTMPGGIGNGYELPWYFVFFVLGFLAIRAGDVWWEGLARSRWIALGAVALLWGSLVTLTQVAERAYPGFGQVLISGGWALGEGEPYGVITVPAMVLHALHSWACCVAVFAWGSHLLNRPHPWLARLNQSVYPLYVTHLAFTFWALAWFMERDWPVAVEIVAACVWVGAGCWVTFEVGRRVPVLRELIGIKAR